ncbi:MAG: AAA family ATPase [candidate division KSB1 bacterium]|nr:AAA family ATPase [candidate division KSB1 bacterium]
MSKDIFDMERLSPALDSFLRSTNPWWENKPGPKLPQFRRAPFELVNQRLHSGLAPAVVLRGPRQVGKTTLQEQLIQHLLESERVAPSRLFRVQFDEIPSTRGLEDPILSLCRWYENRILGQTFNEAAHQGQPAYLFFDEVQNLEDWAPQIKALVDHHTVRVLITGSSALRIEMGRDSLAGRITSLEMGPLLLREVAILREYGSIEAFLPDNGLPYLLDINFWKELREWGIKHRQIRDAAFVAFSERGGYPLAQARFDRPWPEIADYLNETIIQRVLQHDLRLGSRGQKRDQSLLEEVFRLACRYAGQAPGQAIFVNEVKGALHANIGWQRILAYLRFLDSSLLVRLIHPLEIRLKRKKGNYKICLSDHGLRAGWLQEVIPLEPEQLEQAPHLSDLAGHIAESVAGYFLATIPGLDVAHFPQRGAEPEVDFIITIGEKRIPIEIKYRQFIDSHKDTLGLRAFLEKTVYHAPFGLLITMRDDVEVPDPRIVTVPLSTLLLMR